jgi:GT2 family glycosyltransferase
MQQVTGRDVALVVIGRNEGERLKSCLRALKIYASAGERTLVYVDSGSTDGSPQFASANGCIVVELDPSRPFSAARARNEGFACAMDHAPENEFVQFVDGDCDVAEGWIDVAVAAFTERSDVGVVRGHLRERHPEASVYNRLCNMEWRQTPGEIAACGGICMARAEAFRSVNGFRPDVIAAEDDEFCVRVRQAGWKILMVDAPMASHDAAILHFSQWWQRTRRAGHAFAQVAALHGKGEERYFVRDRQRILIWGLLLPGAALVLAAFTYGLSLAAMLGLYALQLVHIQRGCRRRGWSAGDSWVYAFFTVISRFPALQGLIEYHWRERSGMNPRIIEHKRSA